MSCIILFLFARCENKAILWLFYTKSAQSFKKDTSKFEMLVSSLQYYHSSVGLITVFIGMWQMRELEFVEEGDIELDNILLLIAQTGTFIYTSFTIIGGNFVLDVSHLYL